MLMKMYTYRLFPTRKQRALLQWTLDRNREVSLPYHCKSAVMHGTCASSIPTTTIRSGVKSTRERIAWLLCQVCSGCLHEGPHKDLSERVHTCEKCGLVLDRDVNAAINIRAIWHDGLKLRPAPTGKKPKTNKKNAQARTVPSEDAPLRSPRLWPWGVVTEKAR